MTTGVGGVVLAAGRSTRMGRPKPLLRAGRRTFLDRTVATLADGGCDPVVVVLGPDAGAGADREPGGAGARVVVVRNPDADSEQVDSLRLALAALPSDATAALVLPVDHPLAGPDTVRALLANHAGRPDAVLRPAHGGEPGHPTLFPRSTWPALFADPLPRGARSVLERPGITVVDVTVDDPGVVADIDTPEAYRRWLGGSARGQASLGPPEGA